MKRWELRHKGYRIGFVGIFVSSAFFLIGFAAPAWMGSSGLWMDCSSHTNGLCVSYSSTVSRISNPGWFRAVQALECMALLSIMLCIACEIYMDFMSKTSPDRRFVEFLALLGGAFGLTGCIIFASFSPVSSRKGTLFIRQISWAFGLATASSMLFMAFASIMAFFRRRGLDVRNYSASNAIHYQSSDGRITSQEFSGMDLAPPPYSEVVPQSVVQPGGQQATAGPQGHVAQPQMCPPFIYSKPITADESEPPPLYFPPPSDGQFEAPPPYAAVSLPLVPPSAQGSVRQAPGEGATQSALSGDAPGESALEFSTAGAVPVVHPSAASVSLPEATTANPELVSTESETDPDGSEFAGVMSLVPAYYVTVLDQAVPVYHDELLQAGQEPPSPMLVPAYFIMTQGQHIPVYSEEQTKTFTS